MVDTASAFSEKVTLLVYTLEEEPIPGWMRFDALESHYKGSNVTVKWIEKNLPQEPKGTNEEQKLFWKTWKDQISQDLDSPIDMVFGSEDYVFHLAGDLDADTSIVATSSRDILPVSGTLLRGDLIKNWEYLIPEMRTYLRKRICITGVESTGKTTLSRLLSNVMMTEWLPEYGREYVETMNVKSLISVDFQLIAKEHLKREKQAFDRARHVLLVDTDPIVTQVFHMMYLGSRSTELDNLIATSYYDHYIVLPPVIDFVQDGQRSFEDKREEHHNLLLSELRKWKRSYTILPETDMRKRIIKSEKIIADLFETSQLANLKTKPHEKILHFAS